MVIRNVAARRHPPQIFRPRFIFAHALGLIGFVSAAFIAILWMFHFIFVYGPFTEQALKTLDALRSTNGYKSFYEEIGVFPGRFDHEKFKNLVFKSNGKKIVGCFGDSYTYGDEVGVENSYPSRLQHYLGDDYIVFNLGVGGLNSHQLFKMVDFFSAQIAFDYIILGPRTFYSWRAVSFNTYWMHGRIPHLQYLEQGGAPVPVFISGKSAEERIRNYYSFFPDLLTLSYDSAPPGFLKLVYLANRELKNPIKKMESMESQAKEIQKKLLNQLEERFSGKVVFFSDEYDILSTFASGSQRTPIIRLNTKLTDRFPFFGDISHPSPFGYDFYAKKVASEILERDLVKSQDFIFDQSSLSDFKHTGRDKNIENMRLHIDGIPAGNLRTLRTNNRSGSIVEYKLDEVESDRIQFVALMTDSTILPGAIFLKLMPEEFEWLTHRFKRASNVSLRKVNGINLTIMKISGGTTSLINSSVSVPNTEGYKAFLDAGEILRVKNVSEKTIELMPARAASRFVIDGGYNLTLLEKTVGPISTSLKFE